MILIFAIVLSVVMGALVAAAVYRQVTGYLAIRRALRDLVRTQDSLAAAVEQLSKADHETRESAEEDGSVAYRTRFWTINLEEVLERVCLTHRWQSPGAVSYHDLVRALARPRCAKSISTSQLSALECYFLDEAVSHPISVFVTDEGHARSSKDLQREWERQEEYTSFRGLAAACGL